MFQSDSVQPCGLLSSNPPIGVLPQEELGQHRTVPTKDGSPATRHRGPHRLETAMYSNQPTKIPGYGAHHHRHHSDLGDALGVVALLSLILRDTNPGKAVGELVAGIGMLLGALLGVGLFVQLWPASPVLAGLIGAGWFLTNQRSDSNQLRDVLAVELARRTYYLNELALVASPPELAAIPHLWDVTEVSLATRDTVWGLETRWDATFPARYPSQADRRIWGQLCRCEPHEEHRCQLPANVNVPNIVEQIAAKRSRITKLIGRSGADFVLGAPVLSLDT